MRAGSAIGLASWSGFCHAHHQALPSSLVVVSLPATTIKNKKPIISSSVSPTPSICAASSSEVRSSCGAARRRSTMSAKYTTISSAACWPSSGTSNCPSSRWTTRSARRRSSARSDRGTPISSEITSIGTLPAKSAMKSNVPCSMAGSRCSTVICRIRSSSRATVRGLNALFTRVRMRVWSGGSRARKDIVLCASGPKAAGSSETP